MISAETSCVVALAEQAEAIRREEVRRCRRLRHSTGALAAADQVSASVVAALLRPISVHLARCRDPTDAERCIRLLFDLPRPAV